MTTSQGVPPPNPRCQLTGQANDFALIKSNPRAPLSSGTLPTGGDWFSASCLGIKPPLGPKDAGGPGDATPPRGLSMRNQNIAPQIDVCRRRHRQRFLTSMETVMGTLPPLKPEKVRLFTSGYVPPLAQCRKSIPFWSL